jgi:hypothetical protein
MIETKSGNIMLIWNTPYPIGAFLIKLFTGSDLDHCAIILPKDKNNPEPYTYEATLWKVRKMPVPDYWKQLEEWSKSKIWWRRWGKRKLIVEIWSSPTDLDIPTMLKEAEAWMGKPYGIIFNYLFENSDVHCSEYLGRILMKIGYNWNKEPSRITPINVRNTLGKANWTYQSQEFDY